MRHLLIVGRDLKQLISLSLAVRLCVLTTTIALTDDLVGRANWSAARASCRIVVCLEEADKVAALRPLIDMCPPVLFVTPDEGSALHRQLKEAGGLVVAADEAAAVISATLIAYGAGAIASSYD